MMRREDSITVDVTADTAVTHTHCYCSDSDCIVVAEGSKQMLDYELDWTGLDCIALGIACSHHMPLPTVTPCLLFREQLPNVMPLP